MIETGEHHMVMAGLQGQAAKRVGVEDGLDVNFY